MENYKNLTPTFERILVKLVPVADKTEGGLELPEESKDVPSEGYVVSFGEKVSDYITNLKVGDHLMFLRYSGLDIDYQGAPHKLMMPNDVLAIIND